MAYCVHCGGKKDDSHKFCSSCGKGDEIPSSPENAPEDRPHVIRISRRALALVLALVITPLVLAHWYRTSYAPAHQYSTGISLWKAKKYDAAAQALIAFRGKFPQRKEISSDEFGKALLESVTSVAVEKCREADLIDPEEEKEFEEETDRAVPEMRRKTSSMISKEYVKLIFLKSFIDDMYSGPTKAVTKADEISDAVQFYAAIARDSAPIERKQKSRQKATLGNLGAMRSALSIYYGDAEGRYPTNPEELAENRKYLSAILKAMSGHHKSSRAIEIYRENCPSVNDGASVHDSDGWGYCGNPADPNNGSLFVNCTHTDSV